MQKINIRFMVYNAYGIGGTVKTIFNFANYFYKTGKFNVEIISMRRTCDTPTLDINNNIKITVIHDVRRGITYSDEDNYLMSLPSGIIHEEEDLYTMFSKYTDSKLLQILESFYDGILITTMPSFNMLAAQYVSQNVVRIGQEHKSFKDHTPGIQNLIRESYGKLDGLTILTEKNKRIYRREIAVKTLPIYVLGNGTEQVLYRAPLKNKIILAAGRYTHQKGYNMLIEAFANISPNYPDWILKIYGQGELQKQYRELIKKHSLENQIILEPGTNKMQEKLSECSIHVCSSYYEPFGMVIIEGFAMGIPCVSFACDGPSEIISNGHDGLLVQNENVIELASSIEKLIIDEDLRLEMGKNAFKTAQKYDINIIGKALEEIVLSLYHDKTIVPDIINEKGEQQVYIKPIDYDEIIRDVSDGRVGFKTIIKMFGKWMHYKLLK